MNLVCVICSELLVPTDDVYSTSCGHVFHFSCLTKWLDRSKSCPQCREKVTDRKIHRLYFNHSNNDVIKEDASSLQQRVDSLSFTVRLRETEINKQAEKNKELKKQTEGLRQEVYTLETELNKKTAAISAYKDQLEYFKDLSSTATKAQKEADTLRRKLEDYRTMDLLMNAPVDDADDMIRSIRDADKLHTYISVMTRELAKSASRSKQLREKLVKTEQELTRLRLSREMSEPSEVRKLKDKLIMCDSERQFYMDRLAELETKPRKIPKRFAHSSPLNSSGEVIVTGFSEPSSSQQSSTGDTIVLDSPIAKPSGNEENLPITKPTSSSTSTFKERSNSQNRVKGIPQSSILSKKSRLGVRNSFRGASEKAVYDGFGGHSMQDKFPIPIRPTTLKTDVNKKKPRVENNKKITECINLT